MITVDRKSGALLGLAVGDAIGTTLEFSERDSHPYLADMVGGGPFDLLPGQWTDDTAMAVALSESLINSAGFDPHDCATRFLNWYHWGYASCTGTCFDIGITTRTALASFETTGDPFAGSTDRYSAGNGSIMRLAPVAIAWADDPEKAEDVAGQQSRLTHGAAEAIHACRALARLLVTAFQVGCKGALFQRASLWRGIETVQDIMEGSWRDKTREDIKSSGYVIHTLEAACWSVWHTDTFEEAVLTAANLADDADTVAAVTGQIAGALYGRQAIPAQWLKTLAWAEKLERLTRDLSDLNA